MTVQGGQQRSLQSAGLATGARWKASEHMRLAGVAKAFSGAVALGLVDRGELS